MTTIPDTGMLPVLYKREIILLLSSNIKRMEADGNNTRITLADGTKIFNTKTLKYYSEKLNGKGFYRIHDKHLINLSYFKAMDKGRGGHITLTCGERLATSYRCKLRFRKTLKILNGLNDIRT